VTVSLNFHPPVIAHRGASGYAPENTMAAFTKAAQLGIKWIEFDVMQAEQGIPIIFHDDILDRTTNARGNVIQYSYPFLQSLDAGAWFHHHFASEKIPCLQHLIEFLQNTKMSANIEIKALPGRDEELVKRVLAELSTQIISAESVILFSSFSMEALYCLRKYAPQALLGLLLHEWESGWEETCINLQCVSLHINHEIITLETVNKIKSMGKKLLCYTVNEPTRAAQLYAWGVDAVFSDVPDKIWSP
jgi:glycerophosphoryl diester phosphodiesterase